MSSPSFIILSAGKSRIRGCSKPIPFVPFNGTKLINRQISVIKKEYPCSKIILVIGYCYEEVCSYMKNKHPKVKLVKNTDPSGTSSVDSLRLALKFSGDRNTFIVHGDRVFTKSAIQIRDSSYVSYTGSDKKSDSIGLSFDEENSLLHMSYGLYNVWSEIAFVAKEDLSKLQIALDSNIHTLPELINLSQIKFEVIQDRNIKRLKEIL